MPSPAEEQGVCRLNLESARERGNGFAKLPRTRLRHAQVDDAGNVFRLGIERRSRTLDRIGLG
jgi:hypothetical protein